MSYLVLARRWRPQTFEQIRGQEHIVRALRNAITSGRIAHAYVFTGIRGVGKTSAARVLAKALNCVNGPTPTPCNACEACLAITDGRSPDVLEIDGASNTGVEDVRRLREAVRYPPVGGHYRIYIIDEVHMLSTAAFNALLKTLEEPPAHVVFVFATTDAHKIPVTILSRCQQFDFKRLAPRELLALLSDVARAEGIAIEEKALSALAREADGSVRDAQSLLDQVISFAGHGQSAAGREVPSISYADVRDVLGVVDRALLLGVARSVLERDPKGVLLQVAEAERFGSDARRFASDLQDVFRDLSILKAVDEAEGLVDLAPDEVQEAREFTSRASWEEVHALFDMLSKGVELLRNASRPIVALEMTLVKMAKLPPVLSLSEVMAALRKGGPVPAAASLAEPDPGGCPSAAAAPAASVEQARSALRVLLAGAPADEPAPAAQAEAARPDPAPAPAVDDAPASLPALWQGVLAALETTNRLIWNVAKSHGSLVTWDPGARLAVVELDDANQAFICKGKIDVLTEAFRRVTGPGARVELRFAEPQTRGSAGGLADTDRARNLKKEALDHPLVRDALELFDGDLEEVRALKP